MTILKMRHVRRWVRACGLWGTCTTQALFGQHALPERALWAYPSAVIVTQDGGKVSLPEKEVRLLDRPTLSHPENQSPSPKGHSTSSKSRDPVTTLTEKKLSEAALLAEKDLHACAADLRARNPEEALKNPTLPIRMTMPIAADGTVAYVDYEGRPVPPYFVECVSKIMLLLKETTFPPRLDQRPGMARLRLETRFLTEEEAQGRGYQFFAAEENWEKALRQHPEWFRCKKSSDCVTSNERCEIRAVNQQHVEAYAAAMQKRQKRFCPSPPEPALYPASCHHKVCTAAKAKRSRP